MKPSGAHTHPGTGGGGLGPWVAGILIVLAAKVASLVPVPVATALAIATIVGVIAFVVHRLRQGAAARAIARQEALVLRADQAPAIERPREVHLHLHGVSADDIAAILRQHEDTTIIRPSIED